MGPAGVERIGGTFCGEQFGKLLYPGTVDYLMAAGEVEGGGAPDEASAAPQASEGGSSDEFPCLLDGESENGEIGSGDASSGEEPHGDELVLGAGLEAVHFGGFAGSFEGLESVAGWQQLVREEGEPDLEVEHESCEEQGPLEQAAGGDRIDSEAELASQKVMIAATVGKAHYGDLVGRRVLGEAASIGGSAASTTVVAGGRRGRAARRRGRQHQPQQTSSAGAGVAAPLAEERTAAGSRGRCGKGMGVGKKPGVQMAVGNVAVLKAGVFPLLNHKGDRCNADTITLPIDAPVVGGHALATSLPLSSMDCATNGATSVCLGCWRVGVLSRRAEAIGKQLEAGELYAALPKAEQWRQSRLELQRIIKVSGELVKSYDLELAGGAESAAAFAFAEVGCKVCEAVVVEPCG